MGKEELRTYAFEKAVHLSCVRMAENDTNLGFETENVNVNVM